jgi:hypothetical protein
MQRHYYSKNEAKTEEQTEGILCVIITNNLSSLVSENI